MDVLIRAAVASSLLLAACVPDVDIDESRLAPPRLLAVRAEPAEAAPGETVHFVALYADASGTLDEAPIDWAYCTARKPLAELGPVATECLLEAADALVPIGTGIEASGAIPRDACRLFGPEPPPAEAGQPAGRRVDPDATGGYAQPVRLVVRNADPASLALFETRLACGLFGATQAQSAEFAQRYRRNVAPTIEALELVRGDVAVPIERDPIDVAPSETVTLRVRWPECPDEDVCGDGVCGVDETRESCADDCITPRACGGAERFLRFDATTHALVIDRESMRVAWYTSAGILDAERTGVAADGHATSTENALTLPEVPGDIVVLVAVRDARGGTAWRQATLRVRE